MHRCINRAAAAVLVIWQMAAAQPTLVQRIQASFAQSKLKDDRFIVKLEGETVILEGRTRVPQHKGVATRLAKSAGAKVVINRIEIQPGDSGKPLRRAVVQHP